MNLYRQPSLRDKLGMFYKDHRKKTFKYSFSLSVSFLNTPVHRAHEYLTRYTLSFITSTFFNSASVLLWNYNVTINSIVLLKFFMN